MILKEFESRPSGIYLPRGQVAKRFDPERIWRVVWKMTRGLFYKEHSRYLPDDTPNHYSIISAGEKPPPEFEVVRNTPSRGQYPGVFDYKFVTIPKLNNFHFWAMLFWDKLIMFMTFHDPDCSCDKCSGNAAYV